MKTSFFKMNVFMRVIILCLLSFYFRESFSQEFPKLRIDLEKAYGGTFSEYLESIKYIPLETTKASLFGEISNLIITDSTFVITDSDTKSVLFFMSTGKFLTKVSKSGMLSASGAIYDAQNKRIEIVFENSERNKVLINSYSLSGNFVNKGTLTKDNVDFIRNSILIDKNNYWLRNKITQFDSDSNFHFSKYENGLKARSAIPFDDLNRYSLFRLTKELGYIRLPILQSNYFYFSTPLEHKVYEVSSANGSFKPLFQLVFPAKFGINSQLLALQDKKQIDSIADKKWYAEKTVLSLESILYDKQRMIFKTKTGSFGYFASDGSITARNFLYKFQNNRLVAFERIRPDLSTFFLPFCEPRIISYEGFYFNQGYQYTSISSLTMFAAQKATKSKNPQYPAELKKYFATQNRKSNPVIVRMKLKD